jgi:hypothetical protein
MAPILRDPEMQQAILEAAVAAAARTTRAARPDGGRQEGLMTLYAEQFVPELARQIEMIPQRAFEASETHRLTGEYDAGPILQAALLGLTAPVVAARTIAAVPKPVKFRAPLVKRPDTPFFDPSIRGWAGVEQRQLPRLPPPKEIPEFMGAFSDPMNVARVNALVDKGAAMGGRNYQNLEPFRQAFIAEAGSAKGMDDFRLFANLFAGSSPLSTAAHNFQVASYLYNLTKQGQPLPKLVAVKKKFKLAEPLPYPYGHVAQVSHIRNADNVLKLGHLPPEQYVKGASLAENFMGNLIPLTFDRHVLRGFRVMDPRGKPIDALPPNLYGSAERMVQELAATRGMMPAEYRNAMRIGAQDETGLRSRLFLLQELERRLAVTADHLGWTREKVFKKFVPGKLPDGRGLYGIGGLSGTVGLLALPQLQPTSGDVPAE